MKDFASYYDTQFSESEETGSIYEPFTVMLEAAHGARINILSQLDVGDLSDKVVVDFGTGSWGFACVFEKLHHCKMAIGIDISAHAVALSEEKSRNGNFAYGDRFKYLVSDGIKIPLEDNTADVFFTGECIEHVENTDAFLDEIHRVLKPGGTLILTTPNPHPWFYRLFGLEYAVGPEHIALMGYDELNSYLEPRFVVKTWQGYNSSIHPELDSLVASPAFAATWASACVDNPRDACGFVVMAQSRPDYQPRSFERSTYRLTSPSVQRIGDWVELPIHKDLSAHMTKAGGEFTLKFSGDQLVVLLWTHDWSGIAQVMVDGESREVDLYSHFGGFRRVVFRGLASETEHQLRVRATGRKNNLSNDDQVLFFTASSFQTR
ncbi:class I SAM-dependent methyltransferase [Paraburkholderia atlantica]|uniref:class I SAM-dependent methyltransferase n=1 Tax=Paraburkholderia atlantica TaxID=2654982 RepID=UPI001804306C|nr:class I SAM-dependent methyltransferase [Paraburkholderia atlantica]MBB5414124.1 SAM-dependent methyltransferase [Paraburkholderia atlantica]